MGLRRRSGGIHPSNEFLCALSSYRLNAVESKIKADFMLLLKSKSKRGGNGSFDERDR